MVVWGLPARPALIPRQAGTYAFEVQSVTDGLDQTGSVRRSRARMPVLALPP
jgi:hypothetical protein